MTPTVVVFDIGNVLIDWQPHLAFEDAFDSRAEIDAFLERIDFKARNLRCDKGERFADVAAELANPRDRQLLTEYVTRFERAVQGKLSATWDVLHRLQANGVPLHAITNWSSETWLEGLKAHPDLGTVFGVTVISGAEGILKPDKAIFECLCVRADVAPEDCVFIDDSLKNVDGARAAGWDAIHFTDADALEMALIKRGLL
jgi:2-haloacid dehalogenase